MQFPSIFFSGVSLESKGCTHTVVLTRLKLGRNLLSFLSERSDFHKVDISLKSICVLPIRHHHFGLKCSVVLHTFMLGTWLKRHYLSANLSLLNITQNLALFFKEQCIFFLFSGRIDNTQKVLNISIIKRLFSTYALVFTNSVKAILFQDNSIW